MKTKAMIRLRVYRYFRAFGGRRSPDGRTVHFAFLTPSGRKRIAYIFCTKAWSKVGIMPPEPKAPIREGHASFGKWIPVTITMEITE